MTCGIVVVRFPGSKSRRLRRYDYLPLDVLVTAKLSFVYKDDPGFLLGIMTRDLWRGGHPIPGSQLPAVAEIRLSVPLSRQLFFIRCVIMFFF